MQACACLICERGRIEKESEGEWGMGALAEVGGAHTRQASGFVIVGRRASGAETMRDEEAGDGEGKE